jgi:hypothetical protein
MSEDHVHDCTGPDMRCPCGYQFRVSRFSVDFSVYDNTTKVELVSDGFNCDDIAVAIAALRCAAEKLMEPL